MIYKRKRTETVEAVQYTGDGDEGPMFDGKLGCRPLQPAWLADALLRKANENDAIYTRRGRLHTNSRPGVVALEAGHWIVNEAGGFEVWPNYNFHQEFEPAIREADAPDEPTTDIPGGYGEPAHTLRDDLAATINRWSIENDSDTPDFMLADFLIGCLQTFAQAVDAREQWYGRRSTNPLDRQNTGLAQRTHEAIEKGETYPPLEPHPWVAPGDRGNVPTETTYPTGLRDLAAMPHVDMAVGNVLRDCADQIERHEVAPLALLSDAVKGCALIEQGVGWVKVHGVDAEPLFKLLTAAKIAGERA